MDKWRKLIVNGIDGFSQVFGSGPFTFVVEGGYPNVASAQSASAIGHKIQRAAVCREGWLRLPFCRVDIDSEVPGLRPVASGFNTFKKIAASKAFAPNA